MRHRPRVCMISLGCPKNLADSEAILGQIVTAEPASSVCSDPQDADVVIVNTCGFLKAARDEADETLSTVEGLQSDGRSRRIVAVGCYPQLWKEQALSRHPGLSAVMGVDAMFQTEFWKEVLHQQPVSSVEPAVDVSTMRNFEAPRLLSGNGSYAYLKVADGCSQRCTYCTIPQIKGPLLSRTPEAILREAGQLIQSGVKEVILVAQNTSAYGMDLSADHRSLLPDLLRALDDLPGMGLLRVLYLYPTMVTQQLLEVIAGSRHIAHYVDIPLQHTDPDVLRAMGRPWAERSTLQVVDRVRRIMPDAALRSTFIVGFPGETEDQFRRLLADIQQLRLDHASAFAYSREPKAVSSRLPNQVSAAVKKRRLREFMQVQQGISLFVNQERYLDRNVLVMADAVEGSLVYGRTLLDAPDVDNSVVISTHGAKQPGVGSLFIAHITSVGPYDLEGELA